MGSDPAFDWRQRQTDRFNSRSRMGSDPAFDWRQRQTDRFNSRSRMGRGATDIGSNAGAYDMFQFALPHGERRTKCAIMRTSQQVSIRAPAWGATKVGTGGQGGSGVSIRAPAWGATRRCRVMCFLKGVSIRAPAWGATRGRDYR